MKALRYAALLLPVTLAGCLLTTGQFNIDVDLDDAFVSGTSVDREDVDLTTNQDYVDHTDDLVGIADIAVVGNAENFTSSDLEVEAWITPGTTNFTTAAQVRGGATKLWGPFAIAAGAERQVTWDESAALFNAAGKNVLLNEIKPPGDGKFTIYFLNAGTSLAARTEGGGELAGSDVALTGLTLILTIEGED